MYSAVTVYNGACPLNALIPVVYILSYLKKKFPLTLVQCQCGSDCSYFDHIHFQHITLSRSPWGANWLYLCGSSCALEPEFPGDDCQVVSCFLSYLSIWPLVILHLLQHWDQTPPQPEKTVPRKAHRCLLRCLSGYNLSKPVSWSILQLCFCGVMISYSWGWSNAAHPHKSICLLSKNYQFRWLLKAFCS